MRIENLKRLSKNVIDAKARAVLKHYSLTYFDNIVRPTPLIQIIEKAVRRGWLNYDDSSYLGYSPDGSRVLGCYVPDTRTIQIDSGLKDEEKRFNFVLAHEFAHFMLHRKVIFHEFEGEILEDSETLLFGESPKLKTDLQFMEWQANFFASSIMLPRDMLFVKLRYIRREMGLPTRVYVDRQRCTQQDYHETIQQLSDYFKMSKTVIEYRLQRFDLIDDRRIGKSVGAFIDDLFKVHKQNRP